MDEKIEDSSKVKRIVEMLRNARKEQKINVEQLSEGVCTKSMLEKVEWGKRVINRNSLNRLLARLGIDQKKYEKYLYYKDYDEWKEKNDIINAIEDGNLQRAEELLKHYEKNYSNAGKIEQQFCLFMKAQILQNMDKDYSDEIEELYREAMLITVPNAYETETSKLLLSTDELNLILECRNRELYCDDIYEMFDIYHGFIDYIDNSRFDIGGKAKIYPKVVVYMYSHIARYIDSVDDKKQIALYKKILKFCDKAIDILRDDCKAFYLTELLGIHVELLSYLAKMSESADEKDAYEETMEQSKRWLDAYVSVCKQYDMPHLMKDCCYLYREEDVYCISDVIRKRRNMLGMTMVQLCENICDPRTLSRLERRQRNAVEGIVDELFWKLGISEEYVNMGIVTDSKEAVELYEKHRRELNAKELDEAWDDIHRLEAMLPSYSVNTQVVMRAKSMIQWFKEEVTPEQHIKNLNEVLKCTIDMLDIDCNDIEVYYSWLEVSCINAIAMALKKSGKYQEAYDYIQGLIQYFNNFKDENMEDAVIGLYEMVMSFYASLLGSMKEYEESNVIFSKLNRLMLKLKRTNILHFNVYNIAWNNNESEIDEIRFYSEIKRCINLCQLTKNKYYEDCYLQKL